MHRLALLAAILLACGDNKHQPDAALPPDSSPPDAGPGPNTVTITAFSPPDLIKYKDGDGPWLDAVDTGNNTFTIGVTDDYVVLMACAGAGSSTDFDAEEQAHTFSGDGNSLFMGCSVGRGSGSGSGSNVAVTGTMKQAGQIQMGGDQGTSATANWAYNLSMLPGTHDLLAIGDDDNVQIQRAIDVPTAITGPAIDVDKNGVADPRSTLVLDNIAGGAQVVAFSDLATANEFFQVDQAQQSTSLRILPASVLDPADSQFLDAFALTQTTQQTASLFSQGATALPTQLTLIPEVTGVTFDSAANVVTGHWGTLPISTYDDLQVQVFANSNTVTQQQIILASKSWVDKKAATSLAFDTSAPGYKSSWVVDTTNGFGVFSLDATDTATGINYSSEVGAPTTLRIARQHAAHVRQVRGASRKILP